MSADESASPPDPALDESSLPLAAGVAAGAGAAVGALVLVVPGP